MKKKCLLVLRVSTDSQDTESQKCEMLPYINALGYSMEDTIIIEGVGASAVKLNDRYMKMVSAIEDYVNSGNVDCVAVWHLNRLGRNEKVLMQFKELFIKNKCQFACKTPGFKLLNDDGTVNPGSDLAYSLFSTMAKQDADEINRKMLRGKNHASSMGKFVGGKVLYGYKVDSNGFLVIDEEKADVVRLMYQLYSTGRYSVKQLTAELNSRGHSFPSVTVLKMLSNEQYCGHPKPLEPIISDELYNKVKELRNKNNRLVRGERALGSLLIVCKQCGCHYGSLGVGGYRCTNNSAHRGCTNNVTIKRDAVDFFLIGAARQFLFTALQFNYNDATEIANKEIQVLNKKLAESERRLGTITSKKEKVVESYIEGLITKERRDAKLSSLALEASTHSKDITAYKERIELLKSSSSPHIKLIEGKYAGYFEGEKNFEMCHELIKEVTIERLETEGRMAYTFKATDYYGYQLEAVYYPYPKGHWRYVKGKWRF